MGGNSGADLVGEGGGAGKAGRTAVFLWHPQRSVSNPSSNRPRLLFVI